MRKQVVNNRIRSVLLVVAVFLLAPSFSFGQDFSIGEKIGAAKKDLESVVIRKSAKSAKYYETLALYDRKVQHTDWAWKEIALAIMDPQNGETKIIKVLKRGIELETLSNEFSVSINPRLNGVIWNAYNTNFSVVEKFDNSKWLVLAVKFPLYSKVVENGKTLQFVYYSPFSDDLWDSRFRKELRDEGDAYLREQIRSAFEELDKRNILSRAVPGKKISEIIPEKLIYRLILTEQSDPDEFIENQEKTTDRVLMILGANKKNAYVFSTSSAKARGIAQFISGTYHLVSNQYKKAGLPGFVQGTRDHRQSIKASALLNDLNLKTLYQSMGKERADKESDDLLAAAYNGGVGRVNAAFKQYGDEWHKNHSTEIAKSLEETNKTEEEIETIGRKKTDKTFTRSQKTRELRELRKKLASLEKKYKEMENARLRNETRIYLLKFRQITAGKEPAEKSVLQYYR